MQSEYRKSRIMLKLLLWLWDLKAFFFLVLIFSACMHAKSFQLCPAICDPMDWVAHQVPLSMGFSRQEYRSGLPCPPPGDLPDPGIEPTTLTSPVLQIITHKKQQIQSILVKNKQPNKIHWLFLIYMFH